MFFLTAFFNPFPEFTPSYPLQPSTLEMTPVELVGRPAKSLRGGRALDGQGSWQTAGGWQGALAGDLSDRLSGG